MVKGGIKYMFFDALAFIFGPFFTINLWVFHFAYGKFWLYTSINLVMDLVFAYPLSRLFQRMGHYKLMKFNSTIIFIISFSLSLLNYAFQKFVEKSNLFKSSTTTGSA
jgi:hypothetical protein